MNPEGLRLESTLRVAESDGHGGEVDSMGHPVHEIVVQQDDQHQRKRSARSAAA
jgi:hypothetical protein